LTFNRDSGEWLSARAGESGERPAANAGDVLAGGGEVGARMRAMDWRNTPLGPVTAWPQSLKTCVRILLTSRQPMFVWWGEALVNLYNDAYRSIVRGKHPEALGQPASLVWREIWDQVGPRAAAAMEGNEGTYDEALRLIMERNGYPEETYFTFSYSPVPNEQGGIGGVICASTDETQRIVGERQLALLREQAVRTLHARTIGEACARSAEALATNARDLPFSLVYLADADGRHLSLAGASGIARGHLAAPERVAVGLGETWPFADVLASGEARVVDLGDSFGVLPKGAWPVAPSKAVILPMPGSRDVGRAGAVVVGLNPFRRFDDGYRTFLGIVADQIASSIATAHAHEEEQQRREALEEIDREKTAFFTNISHEFRTPLTLMLAPIEDMRATTPRDAEENYRLDLLHRNAQRLLKLVDTLLDFSRIEAGRADAAFEPTCLSALTADVASSFRSAMQRAGLALVVECPPLPDLVYVDRGMWERIVLNLLSNAFKFTFEGSVTVRLRAVDGRVELEVTDTGTGISDRELPRIFERFHRIEGARSRSQEGSGIGLALVQELVRLHGGEIEVTSRLGEGTTFRVRIPEGSAHLPQERVRLERSSQSTSVPPAPYVEDALRSVSSRPEPGPGSLSLGTRDRIVVADDNADMREYLARLLGERWAVEVANDGLEALAAIRREPPDLVLADVTMPGLDGFGLIRAIRDDVALRSTAVILLSARAGEEATAEGLGAGADDYVAKPFTARELLVRVAGRLAATKAARETNEHRKALIRLFMQAPFPITVVRGPDHIIELANDQTRKTARWSDGSEHVGIPLAIAFPEVRENGVEKLLDEVYRTGIIHKGVSEPYPVPTGPGGAFECSYYNRIFAPWFDPNGVIEGVIASFVDVTEQVTARQRVERARAEAEALAAQLTTTSQRLEAAQRVGGIGIYDWQLDEERVYWSPEVFALMGLAPNAIEPTVDAWTRALVPEDREPSWTAFRRAAAAHEDRFEIEVRLRQPDGSARWIRISGLVLYDAGGEPTRSLGALVDIETLKTAARELERANRAKDEFLATMSHELRTPLNAVLGWATILSKKPRDPAQIDRGLEVIQRNARSQERLVSDLLDVSRIISGKLQLTLRRTELAAVVRAAADVVGPAAEAKGVRLVVDLDPDLGAIVGDADRLQQIVWNLLTNAVRFTARGGRVMVTGDRTEVGIRVRVQDTGAGIPREHLQHIFERFRQVDSSTTRAYGGLGLGLAIVRHLVEAHGGSVEAQSDGAGRGATFTILLPILAVDTSSRTAPEAEAEQAPSESAAILRDVRVLVVDDDTDSLELLRLVLGGAGATVTTVRSARDALETKGPFDVIVSDIAMPEMDGYSFMRRMRSRDSGADVPAIALSAYARAEDADRAMRAGFQEHLRKPVDPATLLEAVRAWALVPTSDPCARR
jgi:PAS domain S-box-containing protein